MANTLKFGNGQWATKVGSTLAYNDEGGNFKPLPFNFTRSTSGTRVNKDGLIEVVTNNKPRIDFLNDSNGALLLEPNRSNIITYSEDFSQWSPQDITIVPNVVNSPYGINNATEIIEGVGTTQHRIVRNITFLNSTEYTASVYVKRNVGLRNFAIISVLTGQRVYYDLTNGTVLSTTLGSGTIESVGNGWFKCTVTGTSTSTSGAFYLAMADVTETYTGDGTSSLYIWGCQNEQGSYATSYIPTQGSAVTRIADSCSQTPPSGIIGQTEGTMFIEFDAEEDAPQNMNLINFNNSTQASVLIAKKTSGELRAQVFAGGSALVDINSAIVSGKTKAAIAYKSGDSVLYVNGVGVSDSSTFTFNGTLSDVIFPSHQAYFNYGHKYSVNQALLFKTRLTNAELQSLTQI
jgi:hypothetical protein